MGSEWTSIRLGDACTKIGSGATPRGGKDAYRGGNTALIRSQNIHNDHFAHEGVVYIDDVQAHALRNVEVCEGDVLLNITGDSVARCCQVVPDILPARVNQHVAIIRTRPAVLDAKFLRYVLVSPSMQGYLLALASAGATRNALTKATIESLSIQVPPIKEQRAIAHILGTLDDKIELNRRINQTLEAMAQAIFKSWFVDFDPVKAKIAAIEQGQDPERAAMRAISGKTCAELDQLPRDQYDQLATTAALFPEAMQDTELGEIPQGWEIQRVGDLLELVYGKALKASDRQEGTVPVYGSGGITGYHNIALVPHGSVIVGRKGTVGSLYWEDEPFFPIDTTFYVKPKGIPMTCCYYALQTLGLDKMNTDAAVPGLNRENVYRLELAMPEATVLGAFDEVVGNFRKAIRANLDSSRFLVQLRDTLLPKLISGELSIDIVEGEP